MTPADVRPFFPDLRVQPKGAVAGTPQKYGFNLVESAIVLGVVGLIIGGIWITAADVLYQRAVNNTVEGILYTATRAVDVFKGNVAGSVYQNGVTCIPVINKLVPADWLTPAASLCTWSGSNTGGKNVIALPINQGSGLTIWLQSTTGGLLDYARIGLQNLNRKDCAYLYMALTARSYAAGNSFNAIFPNGYMGSYGFGGAQRPYTFDEGWTRCYKTDGTNYMEITYPF